MAQVSIITVATSVVRVRSRARSLSSVTSRCTMLTAVAKDSVGGSAEGRQLALRDCSKYEP